MDWFGRVVGKRKFETQIDSELRFHIEQKTAELTAQGVEPAEARRRAMAKLGGIEAIKQEYRESRRTYFLEGLFADIRYALRTLRKSPGFTLVAILTLALGIGANTAIFSIVNAVLLRPPPFHDPGRLVQLWETESAPGNYPLTGPDYLVWQKKNRTIAATALLSYPEIANLRAEGRAEPAETVGTQADFFSLLGVPPMLGRGFSQGEDKAGKNRVAVLSYGFWQSRFGGQTSVVGGTVRLNDESYTVIGVMPPSFNFPAQTQIWTPLNMSPGNLGDHGTHQWMAIARLRPGIAPTAAAADLTAIETRLGKLFPENDANVSAVVVPLQQELTRGSRTELMTLLAAVGLVLLVACANLANLLLARASARQREMAVRSALGADHWRLVRQLLTESVTLALLGAALGLALAWATIHLLEATEPLPISLTIDLRVLLFTLAVGLSVGILLGLAPVLQASQIHLGEALKSSGPSVGGSSSGLGRLGDGLVAAEIALSLALLAGTGLFLRTFANMRNVKTGARTRGLLTAGLILPQARYATAGERDAFLKSLLEKVKATPGVESAALSSEIPLEGGSTGYVTMPGNGNPKLQDQLVAWNFISPDYFRVYGVPLLQGRAFTPADLEQSGGAMAKLLELYKASHGDLKAVPSNLTIPAVISRSMAHAFWPGQDAIGKVFEGGPVGKHKVVGVVGDVREGWVTEKAVPVVYFPMTTGVDWGIAGNLTVRTGMNPLSLAGALRGDVTSLDSGLAVLGPRTMHQVISENTRPTGLQAFLLGLFGGLGVLLAAMGIYGVMAYLVAKRTHDIGVRIAFGAQRGDILRLVLAHGAKLAAAGIGAGILFAYGLTRLVASQLYGVKPTDPPTFIAVTAILALVALVACYIPARRAMRIDPVAALRHE